jgi:hypothetical protein
VRERDGRARLDSSPQTEATFVEPMECLPVSRLPEGGAWIWEIKLDGYRGLAVKSATGLTLFSRRMVRPMWCLRCRRANRSCYGACGENLRTCSRGNGVESNDQRAQMQDHFIRSATSEERRPLAIWSGPPRPGIAPLVCRRHIWRGLK